MTGKRYLLAAVLVLAGVAFYFDTAAPPVVEHVSGAPVGQLPGNVEPLEYILDLTIDPGETRFGGEVRINVEFHEKTDLIWLHGKGLEVSESFVIDGDGKRVDVQYDEVGETGVVRLLASRELGPGEATLVFHYSAPFNDALEAIYRVEEAGRFYAFSQMEAISARLAFPGFDEPAFKTPYSIILTVREEHQAVTNTPIVSEENLGNGFKRLVFDATKPMPTYLLAFVVGDLDIVEWEPIPATAVRDWPVPLRGVTVKGKGDDIRYALSHTAEIVNKLEEYFGIPYPYEKLDIIAAPDFAAGAMENVGAIVYREQLMLLNDSSSVLRRQRYASVHAHELAHQWFGNLVTMPWWDDIWLNEAFATWMGHKSAHAWRPQEHFDRLLQGRALRAMADDSLNSARQIHQAIESDHDIANAFDSITYSKGGGVLNMFEQYMGEEAFRNGIRNHLEKHRFGTATAADFLASLGEAGGNAAIPEAFATFLDQSGVPLVEVSWGCAATGGVVASLRQSRYLPLGSRGKSDRLWQIPVCLAYEDTAGRRKQCTLLDKEEVDVVLPAQSCPTQVIPNADGAGYYRWSLSGDGWEQAIRGMDALSEKEILSLADSLEGAVRAGKADLPVYFDAVSAMLANDSVAVAGEPLPFLTYTLRHLTPADRIAEARTALARLYAPLLDELGLTANSPLDEREPVDAALLRWKVVDFLALEARQPELRAELAERAGAYIGFGGNGEIDPGAIDPDLVATALVVGCQELGAEYYDALLAHLENSSDAILRENILTALSLADDPVLAERTRSLILSSILRDNEVDHVLEAQAFDTFDSGPVWRWLRDNFDAVLSRTPEWRHGKLIELAGSFCDEKRRLEIREYFRPMVDDLSGGPRELDKALEKIELCTALTERQRPVMAAYLSESGG